MSTQDAVKTITELYEPDLGSKTKIQFLYSKIGTGYFDKYGGSFLITGVSIIFILGLISYFNVKKNITTVKEKWNDIKCDPRYAPFAGMIVPQTGRSFLDIGRENAEQCFNNALKDVSEEALVPYHALLKVLNTISKDFMEASNAIRSLISSMREKLQSTFEEQYNRLMNITIPLQQMFIALKDIMAKTKASMVASLYPMLGMYYILKSAIKVMYGVIVKILIGLVSSIVLLWIFPFTWGAAASMTVIFMLIMVPMALLSSMMGEVFHLSPGRLPKSPRKRHCFNGSVELPTQRGYVPISKLVPGDILGKSVVTSVMKLDATGQTMFDLGNGLYVSGTHKIFNYTTNTFNDVADDERFLPTQLMCEPFVYCFNTTSKMIRIDNHLFLDYDELTNDELSKLIIEFKDIVPKTNFNLSSLHKTFDGGLHPDCNIILSNGTSKKMSSVVIGDKLKDNIVVEGVVLIDTTSNIMGNIIINSRYINGCYGNIILQNGDKQVSTTTMVKLPTNLPQKTTCIHLTTDKGYFIYNGIKIYDYNACLEHFIER